ncbi:MAG: exodeoxyribonuclease VII large subunit [Pseudomonadota bacterium]|nr:MAG: exodeoxyribonuclease VII large subunit [Pseudomonadota bacterium]
MQTAPPGPETHVYRPAELNREVRLHLEAGFSRLWVRGEVSNLARPASGHLYFTLKDARAQLRCALFRSQASGLAFQPGNGSEILVRGRLSLYEPRGDYQLIADTVLEAGAGALALAFEALKQKLAAEGLFDEAAKRALPRWPRRISVVTSPSGAAIRDILQTLARRWPHAQVRIYPSAVQGEQAPAELVRAVRAADRHAFGEVIILARGGGSLEDLWAFNDEALARTLHDLDTPVVTGIGHETDFSIADFVADLRAPTPTGAAVAATPDGPGLREQLHRTDQRLANAARHQLRQAMQQLDHLQQRLSAHHPKRRLAQLDERFETSLRRGRDAMRRVLQQAAQRLTATRSRLETTQPARRIDHLEDRVGQARQRLQQTMRIRLERDLQRLDATTRTLHGVGPLAVLQRGYAVVRDPDGHPLTRPDQFSAGQPVNLLMHRFEISAEITGDPQPGKFE